MPVTDLSDAVAALAHTHSERTTRTVERNIATLERSALLLERYGFDTAALRGAILRVTSTGR